MKLCKALYRVGRLQQCSECVLKKFVKVCPRVLPTTPDHLLKTITRSTLRKTYSWAFVLTFLTRLSIYLYIFAQNKHTHNYGIVMHFSPLAKVAIWAHCFFFCNINIICISVYVECVLVFVPMSLYVIYCEGVRFFFV